jgi:hypothetical protein
LPGEPSSCEIASVYGCEEAHQVIEHAMADYDHHFGR